MDKQQALENIERMTDKWIKPADAAAAYCFSENKIRQQAREDLDAGRVPGVLSLGFRCYVAGQGVRVDRESFVNAVRGATYADTETEQNKD